MRNLVALSAKVIPYSGYLRKFVKSIPSTILFQQLEYWFDKKGGPFFKFLEPCENKLYKEGDSWTEELYFSKDEFRSAFDNIGVRYGSKKEYDSIISQKKDPFMGMFYCSYHDKISGLTWYFRNDSLIEKTIEEIVNSNDSVKKKENLRKSTNPISVNRQTQFTEIDKPDLQYTESTTKTTTKSTEKRDVPQDTIEHEILKLIENDIKQKNSSPPGNYSLKNKKTLNYLMSKYSLAKIKEAIPEVTKHPNFGERFSFGGYLVFLEEILYSENKIKKKPGNNLLTNRDGQYDGNSATKMSASYFSD